LNLSKQGPDVSDCSGALISLEIGCNGMKTLKAGVSL
jgi:hypothetical protein